MRSINFSDARNRLKDVFDQVVEDRAATRITRRDYDDVVVMSAADYSAMEETLYLLGSPANAGHLMAGVASIRAHIEAARAAGVELRILGPEDVALAVAAPAGSAKRGQGRRVEAALVKPVGEATKRGRATSSGGKSRSPKHKK